jgi:hypothetical protein
VFFGLTLARRQNAKAARVLAPAQSCRILGGIVDKLLAELRVILAGMTLEQRRHLKIITEFAG